jgi:hypothetical protein
MPNVKQVGGGAAGHIHIVASGGTVWDSAPADHLNVLNATAAGPAAARQHAAANTIATNIAKAFGSQLDASQLLLTIDWTTGNATGVRVG